MPLPLHTESISFTAASATELVRCRTLGLCQATRVDTQTCEGWRAPRHARAQRQAREDVHRLHFAGREDVAIGRGHFFLHALEVGKHGLALRPVVRLCRRELGDGRGERKNDGPRRVLAHLAHRALRDRRHAPRVRRAADQHRRLHVRHDLRARGRASPLSSPCVPRPQPCYRCTPAQAARAAGQGGSRARTASMSAMLGTSLA